MKSDRFRLTPKSKLGVMAVDVLLFTLMVSLTARLRLGVEFTELVEAPSYWLISFFVLACLYVFGNYDLDRGEKFWFHLYRCGLSLLVAFIMAILVNYILGKERAGVFGRGVLLGSFLGYFVTSLVFRFLLWTYLRDLRSSVRILVFTDSENVDFLQSELKKNNFSGQWSFALKDGKTNPLASFSWGDIKEIQKLDWSAWVLAAPMDQIEKDLGNEFLKVRFTGIRIIDLSRFYEHTWRKIPVFHLGASWFFLSEGFGLLANPMRIRFKRLTDIFISLVMIILLWPFMVVTALLVKIESPGHAVYRQTRTGKDGEPFTILKFRSMRNDAEIKGAQWAQKNDARVTRVGRFIRLTRLDELPQLWNVFRGDMSFIGPRPERPEFNVELAEKIPYYDLRHSVRPGLTGWAQICYPYGASVEDAREKLQYDLFYIKNFSFTLDLQIILKTINVVILGKGR